MKKLIKVLILTLTLDGTWAFIEGMMNLGFIWAEDGRVDVGLC